MTSRVDPENLHRLVKHLLDSGEAQSIAQAEEAFRGYRLVLVIDSAQAEDPLNQAALLTAIALGRRVFLGGVHVEGSLDTAAAVPLPLGPTLRQATTELGGIIGSAEQETPTIFIGGGPRERHSSFGIRTAASGWRGGILPAHAPTGPSVGSTMPLAAMLSAGLAINEAFQFVSTGVPSTGRQAKGFSLWKPDSKVDWLAPDVSEPKLEYLPSRLWLIGLGHLGQAYLWGLGLLPYADPQTLSIVLQDIDIITSSTESTSILSDATSVGMRKTRAMATWAERRGFKTVIHERLFDANFRRQPDEPAIALCGLDNALGRRALDHVGFDMIVEAGLGRGYRDFRTMRLHTLPGPRSAVDIWKPDTPLETLEDRTAYRRILESEELDRCGVTLLAGKAVGAPFVGAVAATLVLSEVLRHLHGGLSHHLIDLDLLSIEQRLSVPHSQNFQNINTGYALARV